MQKSQLVLTSLCGKSSMRLPPSFQLDHSLGSGRIRGAAFKGANKDGQMEGFEQ
jgi:hypothetical protein